MRINSIFLIFPPNNPPKVLLEGSVELGLALVSDLASSLMGTPPCLHREAMEARGIKRLAYSSHAGLAEVVRLERPATQSKSCKLAC